MKECEMNIVEAPYAKGEWIVHSNYGVGQIKEIGIKTIEDKRNLYYRVETSDGVYWLTIQNSEAPRIRPISSKWQLKKALTLLRKPPKQLADDFKDRRDNLRRMLSDGSLYSKACLIRDLHGKLSDQSLNLEEDEILRKVTRAFTNEWAVIDEIEPEEAKRRLNSALLRSSKQSIS